MGEYISIAVGFVALISVVIKMYLDMDAKASRQFKRLDEVKEYQDRTFTRKDICSVVHKQIDDKLTSIQTDIKILLKQNGYEK